MIKPSLLKKGQSTLEYAIIITVVIGALLAMQIYFKRGLQGKLKESSDNIGQQYSAGLTTSSYTTTVNTSSTEATTPTSGTSSTITSSTQISGSENISELANETVIGD
jgi:uncharacterized protein (UPF0333 family)